MKKLVGMSLAVVLTIFLAFGTGFAGDNSLPSSKAAVAISELIDLSVAAGVNQDPDAVTNNTGWVSILTTYIKTPNQKELAFDVALQCGLITDTTVKSKGGTKDASQAEGSIRVRVKVTHPEGSDPEFSYALPSEEGDEALGVTYCDRLQRLEAKFAGLDCFAAGVVITEGVCDVDTCTAGNVGAGCSQDDDCDLKTGEAGDCSDAPVTLGICGEEDICTEGRLGAACELDTECDLYTCTAGREGAECSADADCDLSPGEVWCETPEELRLLLETLNANAFNFLLPNLRPGVHKIEVQAMAEAGVDLSGTALGMADAEAFVGLGSMLVETVRLIKGAEDNTGWFELK